MVTILYKKVHKRCNYSTATHVDIAEVYLINRYKPIWNTECNSTDIPTLIMCNLDSIIEKEFHVDTRNLTELVV